MRRFQCQQCHLVVAVTSEALLPRKHHGAGAIGLALWLWSVARRTEAQVRREVSPLTRVGAAAVTGWASLKRWAQEVCCGGLWQGVETTLLGSLRGITERVMGQLEALGPIEQSPAPAQRLWHAAHQCR